SSGNWDGTRSSKSLMQDRPEKSSMNFATPTKRLPLLILTARQMTAGHGPSWEPALTTGAPATALLITPCKPKWRSASPTISAFWAPTLSENRLTNAPKLHWGSTTVKEFATSAISALKRDVPTTM